MPWYVYILECAGGHCYVGHTEDLDARFKTHLAGMGADFTRRHPPRRMVFTEESPDELSAVRRELQLKRWSRVKKPAHAAGELAKVRLLARRRRR
jgi:putative endonuclease